MSTYLMAFAVTNYISKSRMSSKNIKVEVAAKPVSIDAGEGDYALNEAVKIIDFFADYFNVDYPLTKSSRVTISNILFHFMNHIWIFKQT